MEEACIYYSKKKALNKMMFALGIGFVGGYFLLTNNQSKGDDSTGFAVIFSLCLLFFVYKNYRRYRSAIPQIILNKRELFTAQAGACKWEQIQHEVVYEKQFGKGKAYYLEYWHPAGPVSIRISDLDIEPMELHMLLIEYRKQNQNIQSAGV
ncbi:hypothetical protein [Mucilaginibacter pedocola]|uniref:Uncharacterized protein n=1 Tax=Mucilaginibacter pedocola TaxID=1792845 RepID=A0A1S9PH68_9SPHI|nr:hypothetical protein [Mucilaginibacter pedocola]OOQ60277.1 hypothetical protein BC343_26340 [Mucilaginibacter pedocola]